MRFINTGKTRFVFLIGRWAVKFPYLFRGYKTFRRGVACCRTERIIWRRYKSSQLCPVVFASPLGLFVVMRRAAQTFTRDVQFGCDFLGDDSGNNYGILNGKIVKVDYGNVPRLAKLKYKFIKKLPKDGKEKVHYQNH